MSQLHCSRKGVGHTAGNIPQKEVGSSSAVDRWQVVSLGMQDSLQRAQALEICKALLLTLAAGDWVGAGKLRFHGTSPSTHEASACKTRKQ